MNILAILIIISIINIVKCFDTNKTEYENYETDIYENYETDIYKEYEKEYYYTYDCDELYEEKLLIEEKLLLIKDNQIYFKKMNNIRKEVSQMLYQICYNFFE